jgi:fatty acid desaturase
MATQDVNQINWYRTPIPREELKKLTKKRDLPALAQTLGFLLVVAATFAVSWMSWEMAEAGNLPVWVVIVSVFIHGTVWAFLLNGFHELVHGTVFKTKRLNTFFLYVYSYLGAFDPIHFKASHMRHHKYTLHPPKDREVQLPIRLRLWHFLRIAVINPLALYRRTLGYGKKALGFFESPWQKEIIEEKGEREHTKLIWFARTYVLLQAGVVAAAIATRQWQLIVLVTLAPFYGEWLRFLCNDTQHIGLADNIPDFRLCCRTFTLNPFVRFLYWHMNYHIEHHMYAAVPCYNLHKLHKMIRYDLPDVPHGIIGAWREIISILKKQEEEPDYQYVPEVPNPRLA